MTAPLQEPGTEPPAVSDRGVSPIAGRLGGRHGRWITLAALVVGCGVFLAATWDRGEERDGPAPDTTTPPRQLSPFEPARRSEPPLLADAAGDPEAPRLSDADIVPALEPTPQPEGPTAGPSPAEARRTLAESARRAPVMAFTRPAAPMARQDASADIARTPEARTPLDALRQVAPVERSVAGTLPDRDLLMTAGTVVPCVLQTALDSTTPGYVSCILPRPVYSESGAVVLMDRGTRVLGEYGGGVQQGRRRLFIVWTRAVTPTGVTIELASPAADALGRAGFEGTVDTRFWDRFGGALLLSLVDDGAALALDGDGGTSRTTRLPSDAAATALQGSIDIPPTLRTAQGSEVSIFVARDLDFRGVYRLRPR